MRPLTPTYPNMAPLGSKGNTVFGRLISDVVLDALPCVHVHVHKGWQFLYSRTRYMECSTVSLHTCTLPMHVHVCSLQVVE